MIERTFAGKRALQIRFIITGFSWYEEILANKKKKVSFNLEEELKDRHTNYRKAIIPMTSKVCEDGNLITGQNAFSSKAIAEKVMERLKNKVPGYHK